MLQMPSLDIIMLAFRFTSIAEIIKAFLSKVLTFL